MSSLPPRIPPQLARRLPWDALYLLFGLKRGINELETTLGLQQGTLSKAQREYPVHKQGRPMRGISAKVHQHLLESMVERFQTADQMRAWIKKNWAVELLELSASYLDGLYDLLDFARQIPQVGVFPKDHIPRKKEEAEIVDLLLTDRQVQVIWITGVPGVGKRTLALSLVRQHWERLKQEYDKVFWVDADQASYADGLRQIAAALDIVETSVGVIEMKIKHLTRRKKVLIILDALHDVDGLTEWRHLIGYLGRLVVASRTRLAKNELMSDDQIHQVNLEGFSKEQGREFIATFYDDQAQMENQRATDAILEYTAGHPLALRILSGPMIELGLSSVEMQQRLEQNALDALEYPLGLTACESSLRMCFDITYQALTERHPDAVAYFQSAGVFRARTIHTNLMGQVQSFSTPLAEDKMAAALLHFNFLNVLKLNGERFIQLHPLLHEYAREKLALSDTNLQIREHYLEVVPEWVQVSPTRQSVEQSFPLAWHSQDILAVLKELITKAEGLRTIRLLKQSFEILAAEGYVRQLEQVVHVRQADTGEYRLLRVVLANLKGHLALSVQDVIPAQEQFVLALRMGQGASLAPDLDQTHLDEMAQAILGIARCLIFQKEYRAALDLLEGLYSRDIFKSLLLPAQQVERALLLGEIHDEMCDYGKALECYQAALQLSPPGKKYSILERQADCHRNLHELEKAIGLYSSLLFEQNQPTDFRIGVGLGLAASLLEVGRLPEALQALVEVEDILGEYAGLAKFNIHFAQLWKYRAFAARAMDEKQTALEYARKSIGYWMRVSDSEVEEKKMWDLVYELMHEMRLDV